MSIDQTPNWKTYVEQSELYSKTEPLEKLQKFVIFALEEEWYGLEAKYVREVTNKASITWLPFVPNHIFGFINLRGDIISVTHLKTILGLKTETFSEDNRFVVIEDEGLATALIVDGSVEILDVPLSRVDTSFSLLGLEKEKWFMAKIQEKGRFIAILEAKKLLEITKVRKS